MYITTTRGITVSHNIIGPRTTAVATALLLKLLDDVRGQTDNFIKYISFVFKIISERFYIRVQTSLTARACAVYQHKNRRLVRIEIYIVSGIVV